MTTLVTTSDLNLQRRFIGLTPDRLETGYNLFSLGIGQWFHGMVWLPLLVAAIVWIKGIVIARYFIESQLTHPFIRRVLRYFIAFTPVALVLVVFFGGQFARWATL